MNQGATLSQLHTAPSTNPAPASQAWLYAAALALLAVLTFGRATFQAFPYVWEDKAALEASGALGAGSLGEAVRKAFLGRTPADDRSNTYRPLARTSLLVSERVAGWGSLGQHFRNLALHVLAVLLLFLLARRMFGLPAGTLAAALFAAHPLAAGSVGYVAARADLLLGVLGLGAIVAWRRAGESGSKATPFRVLAWALAFLAMLSHEGGATLVLIAPLLDHFAPGFRRPKNFGGFVLRNIGLWAGLGIYVALRLHAHPNGLYLGTDPNGRPLYLATSLARLLFYDTVVAVVPAVSRFLAPLVEGGPKGLALTVARTSPLAAAALPLVLAMLAVDVWIFVKNRALGVGLAWYWLALLPMLDVTLAANTGPDRALYFALPGLCLSCAALAELCWRRFPARRRVVVGIAGVWLALSVVLGLDRVGLWRSESAWPQRLADQHPRSATAWNELGAAYGRAGDTDQALFAFRRAHQADTTDVDAALNLGLAYSNLGKADSAMYAMAPVAYLVGTRPELNLAVGHALLARNEMVAARQQFEEAVAKDSSLVDGWMGIAEIQYRIHAYAQAMEALRSAARFAPQDPRISNDLGMICMDAGDGPRAEAAFARAIEQDSTMAAPHYNLARLRYLRRDYEGALTEVNKLIRLLPDNPGPRALRDTLLVRLSAGHSAR